MYNDCFAFFQQNGLSFFNIELAKAMLLQGEMEPLLRACAMPDIGYLDWWCVEECHCMCGADHVGWDRVLILALNAYMCLNILYCKPDLWDSASGRCEDRDYRLTKGYQSMVEDCTSHAVSEVQGYPHREFFGVAMNEAASGRLSVDAFLARAGDPSYHATSSDVRLVSRMLQGMGLPAELVMYILDAAEYVPRRRLKVPHDPLHGENKRELERYLTHCWETLLRCEMMATALGATIPWNSFVSEHIIWSWGPKPSGMYKEIHREPHPPGLLQARWRSCYYEFL